MIKAGQHFTLHGAIPFEKGHFFPEQCRNQYQWVFPVFDLFQVLIPEFIFHENDQGRVDDLQELFGIFRTIHRQVEYPISPLIFFPYLITGWGEEGEQDLGAGKGRM
jgi:hypothetical protein